METALIAKENTGTAHLQICHGRGVAKDTTKLLSSVLHSQSLISTCRSLLHTQIVSPHTGNHIPPCMCAWVLIGVTDEDKTREECRFTF